MELVKGTKPLDGATCFWFLFAPFDQWEEPEALNS